MQGDLKEEGPPEAFATPQSCSQSRRASPCQGSPPVEYFRALATCGRRKPSGTGVKIQKRPRGGKLEFPLPGKLEDLPPVPEPSSPTDHGFLHFIQYTIIRLCKSPVPLEQVVP